MDQQQPADMAVMPPAETGAQHPYANRQQHTSAAGATNPTDRSARQHHGGALTRPLLSVVLNDSAAPAAAPMENTTPFGWVKTPKGILRMVEWLLTLIMFATMASVDHFDTYSDFKFMVAAGVLGWLYVMTLMVVYVFRARIEQSCTYLPPIELVLDGVLVVFCLAAGASCADRCNHRLHELDGTAWDGETVCNNAFISKTTKNDVNASIVFAFFSMIAFMVSFYYSWRDNAKEEAKR